MDDITVISLGGSMVYPDEIDIDYVKNFYSLISIQVDSGRRFIIIVGGGKLARKYQDALSLITKDKDALDWVGVGATHANAVFIREVFGDKAEVGVVIDPSQDEIVFQKPVLIGAGWKPGWSTDYDSVYLAHRFGAKRVINISNIEYVYSGDPNLDKDAEKYTNISWEQYFDCIPKDWTPGLSTPFDPKAATFARDSGIEVSIVHGRKFEEIRKAIDHEEFDGTIIK